MIKRMFLAELVLVLDIQAHEDTGPMHVLHVSTIDDVPCYRTLFESFILSTLVL